MPSVTRLRIAVLSRWTGNQLDLSRRCAIDNGDLSRYLRGQMPMRTAHRAVLAHVLAVEPAELDGWVMGDELWFWQRLAS